MEENDINPFFKIKKKETDINSEGWVAEKIDDKECEVQEMRSKLAAEETILKSMQDNRVFWEAVEKAGIDTDILEELYRIGKLTKDDLIEELEWLCRYYENLYDEIEHSASRSYVNEVADQIEKYRSWIKAVDNIEEE